MENQIVLPILEIKSKRFSKYLSIFFLTGCVGLFVNIFYLEIKFLFAIFSFLIISVGLVALVYDNSKNVGFLILNSFEININKTYIIPIKEIKNLKFYISGYEGKFSFIDIRGGIPDSGNDNFIEFSYRNKKFKNYFSLSYQNYLILNNIIEKLKIENQDIFK